MCLFQAVLYADDLAPRRRRFDALQRLREHTHLEADPRQGLGQGIVKLVGQRVALAHERKLA